MCLNYLKSISVLPINFGIIKGILSNKSVYKTDNGQNVFLNLLHN